MIKYKFLIKSYLAFLAVAEALPPPSAGVVLWTLAE